MAAPTSVEIPAARLRVKDLLPAYGPSAMVSRPPIVSVDGSMINVVISEAEDGTGPYRLVRMPVGLRIEALRPVDATGFVRSTKTAKSSGARIVVLDLASPDAEIAPGDGERFATLCTVHHTLKPHSGVSTAEAQASHPEQWCTGCADGLRTMAQARVYGTRDVRNTA